jgi:hypothetical protein
MEVVRTSKVGRLQQDYMVLYIRRLSKEEGVCYVSHRANSPHVEYQVVCSHRSVCSYVRNLSMVDSHAEVICGYACVWAVVIFSQKRDVLPFCSLLFCAFMGNFANWHLTGSIQFTQLTIRIFFKLTRWSFRLYIMEEGDSKYPLLPSKHEGIFEDCNFWTRWVYLLWEIWVKKFNIFPSVPSDSYTI